MLQLATITDKGRRYAEKYSWPNDKIHVP